MVSGGAALLSKHFRLSRPSTAKLALQLDGLADDRRADGRRRGQRQLVAARRAGNRPTPLTALLPTSVVGGRVAKSSGVAYWDRGGLSQRLDGRDRRQRSAGDRRRC